MFKKDTAAQFIRLNRVEKERLLNILLDRIKPGEREQIVLVQQSTPVALRDSERTVWLYQGSLYCEDNSITSRYVGFYNGIMLRAIKPLSANDFWRMMEEQKLSPVMVYKKGQNTWWMFQGNFYCEDEGHSAEEIQSRILPGEISDGNRTRILAGRNSEKTKSVRRESISDEVKMYVWRRDEGKCVKCGSQRNLEFDHIIPLSLGGSNTARNIQLLCQVCNRAKGGSIV
jgi:hypothetical protein